MLEPGDIIGYVDMCNAEGVSLQRGMNFHLGGSYSVILMSRRSGAPYEDQVIEDGKILIYEGHDAPRQHGGPNPKNIDQPLATTSGKLTQNGLFVRAAASFKEGRAPGELVRVYEKIKDGIWVYAGIFKLVDSWEATSNSRKVLKFKLEIVSTTMVSTAGKEEELTVTRMIPTTVKVEVWKRDKGKCVLCGRADNLHFDHVLPYSKGGSSLVAKNIQLLCVRHNLAKRDNIE